MKIPEGLKSSIGAKILGKGAKSIASKVSGGGDSDNTTLMFKVIAKNFIALPGIARDLNVTKQNIMQLVKLEGGKPSKDAPDAPMGSKVLSSEEAQAKLDKELEKGKEKTPTPAVPKKPGGGGLLGTITKMFKVGAVIFALSQIPGGFIKDMFDGIIDSIKELASLLLEEIKTAFDGFVTDIKKFFNDVVQPILDELTAFLQKVWQKITDFFKPIFNWVGDKIKTIIDYLQPVFDFMKGVLDKVFVVVNALKEKLAYLQPIYDSLVEKVNKVKSFLGLDEKKAEAPAVKSGAAAAKPLPSTGAGGGRGGQGGPTAAENAKRDLTPSQLKWLGNADPTDSAIMSRLPAPIAGEKGGPPAPKPAAAPAAPSGPSPVASGGKAPAMGSLDDTKKMIIRHEGMKDMPYKDSLGLWTVGVGHLIGNGKTLPPEYNRKFTQAEIMKMFDEDFDHHAKAAQKIPGYSKVNQQGQGALIDLTFNMGNSWYKGFPSFVKKLAAGDFKGAADELMYKNASDKSKGLSDYYQQVKGRAQTIVGLIMGAGEGGAAPTPPTPLGGETKVVSAAPSPAPSPAPSAPATTPKATSAPSIPAPKAQPSAEPASAGKPSLSQSITTQAGVEIGKFNKSFEERIAMMAAAFKAETGKKLLFTSGFRTNEQQKVLWDAKVKEFGGDEKAAGKLVARPAAPLGTGKGSLHAAGLAVDINSQGEAGINRLAGTWDKPTGWLEKFGLSRPIAKENWHVQAMGTPPTSDNPNNPGSPALVPDASGKATDVTDGKTQSIKTGETISSASTEVAADQRQQQKPTTPIIVNAPTTNITTVVKNESVRNPNEKRTDPSQTLLARAT
jgi:GH24 family phage-related lysozyme (muramidase)